jgi:hypothetical protein
MGRKKEEKLLWAGSMSLNTGQTASKCKNGLEF